MSERPFNMEQIQKDYIELRKTRHIVYMEMQAREEEEDNCYRRARADELIYLDEQAWLAILAQETADRLAWEAIEHTWI